MSQQLTRQDRKQAARELREAERKAKAFKTAPPPQFDTEEDANKALSATARVLNMEQKQKEKEAKSMKENEKRTKLPPLPRAKAKPKTLKPCECGCGGQTTKRFVPGHDSRQRGWVLRVERGYVKLSEIPDGERQAVAAVLRAKSKAAEAAEG